MNRYKEYFKKKFKLKVSSKDWFKFNCPFCGKKDKAAIHVFYFKVKCWSCGYNMDPYHFLAAVDNISIIEARDRIFSMVITETLHVEVGDMLIDLEKSGEVVMPYSYTNILDDTKGHIGDRARNYIEGRGVDLDYCEAIGVGYCYDSPLKDSGIEDWNGYVVSPFIADGILKYYTGRNFVPTNYLTHKFPAKGVFNVGKSELIFNEDAKYGETVIGVESVMCALTLGPMSMGFCGKDVSHKQLLKLLAAPFDNFVLCLDAGTKLESCKLGIKLLTYKDNIKVKVCDLGYYEGRGMGKDPNEIGKDEIMYFIKHTEIATIKSLYATANEKDTTTDTESYFV